MRSSGQTGKFSGKQDDILWKPSVYPVCRAVGHIHDDSDSTTFSRTVLAAPSSASLSSLSLDTSSIPAPLHIKRLTDVSSIDNNISVHKPHHSAYQTALESRRIDVTLPDPVTVRATQ